MTAFDEEPEARERRPRSRRAAGRACAAYLEAGLGWLAGFPTATHGGQIHWRTRSRHPVDEITPEVLRASFYALRGARRKFPRGLPEAVGDVDVWVHSIETRLRLLQGPVHRGLPLPSAAELASAHAISHSQGLSTEQRRVQAKLDPELIWLHWDDPGAGLEAADRIRRWATALQNVDFHLGAAASRRLRLGVVAVLDPQESALDGLRESLEHSIAFTPHQDPNGEIPAGSVASALLDVIHASSAPVTRALVAAAFSSHRAADWQAAWLEHGEVQSTLVCDVEAVRNVVATIEASYPAAVVAKISRIADSLGDGPKEGLATRRSFLDACGQLDRAYLTERRTQGLFDLLEKKLVRARHDAVDPGIMLAFARLSVASVFEFEWKAACVPWSRAGAALDALLAICATFDGNPALGKWMESWKFLGALEGLLCETVDAARVAQLLAESDGDAGWSNMRVAVRLISEECPEGQPPNPTSQERPYWPKEFWATLDALGYEQVESLLQATAVPEVLALARAALANGTALRDLARFAGLYTMQPKPWPPEPSHPPADAVDTAHWQPWIPESLWEDVRALAALRGEAATLRVLAPELEPPDRIEREVRGLKERLADESVPAARRFALEKRLGRRTARLDPGWAPSPKAVRACEARIRRALYAWRMERWSEEISARAIARLPEPMRGSLDLASDRANALVVGALAQLPKRTRDLGFRVLAERAGTRPWDLRNDPANVAWRQSMLERGVDLAPWWSIEAFGTFEDPVGTQVTFAFEEDPLEVMKMGYWFDTCLAPGGMNFFSTVANAVDANKRVLIGRAPDGVVRTRCLLALTEASRLLVFHPYAHEHTDWVEMRVQEIANGLADSMGTPIAAAGHVARLVSTAWYDDGPRDLSGRLETLQPGKDLEQALTKAPPREAFRMVTDAFGKDFVAASLEQILGFPVFVDPPSRMASFEPFLTTKTLPRALAIRAMATLADEWPELAQAILKRLGPRRLLHRMQLRYGHRSMLCASLRSLGLPGLALRVVRAGATFQDDNPADLRREEATTLRALGREQQAAALMPNPQAPSA